MQTDHELLKSTIHIDCEDKIKSLQNKIDILKNTLALYDEYTTISFPNKGECNFCITSEHPYSIMVKKGTNIAIIESNKDKKEINIEECKASIKNT